MPNPVLFLSVLLDELQMWHRPPVGRELRRDVESIDSFTEDDLRLSSDGDRVRITYPDTRAWRHVMRAINRRLDRTELGSIATFDKILVPKRLTMAEKLRELLREPVRNPR
jgi:hypothetical protein